MFKCSLYITFKCSLYITFKCSLYITFKCSLYITFKCSLYITFKCSLYITFKCSLYFTFICNFFSLQSRRYKMISARTWPNLRGGGTAREGVEIIVTEQGYSDDVKYGATKLFIRHPQTLLSLETARANRIPGLCVLLQKVMREVYADQSIKLN